MQLLVISDIFGLTPVLETLARSLHPGAEILDPYLGRKYAFDGEEDAYQAFLAECGHDTYAERVRGCLSQLREPTRVIAFSAGAVAAWRALAELSTVKVTELVGFYPGQIRDYLMFDASVPTRLIFPNQEAHFDVEPVIRALSEKQRVVCEHSAYSHGFMNALSRHFSIAGYGEFIQKLQTGN